MTKKLFWRSSWRTSIVWVPFVSMLCAGASILISKPAKELSFQHWWAIGSFALFGIGLIIYAIFIDDTPY